MIETNSANKTPVLEINGLNVARSGRKILDIDSLEINEGEFVGIIGTNGAGKTTLLRACMGMLSGMKGSVKFQGSELSRCGSWQKTRLRRKLGLIPQAAEYRADLPFTVREVAAMGPAASRGLLKKLTKADYESVDKWLATLGLQNLEGQTFRSLSGGEQQKVLIARAMASEPELLLLDEPGSNLDFHWKHQLTELVGKIYAQTGITIIMVSHETNLLPGCCKRVVLLADGRPLYDGGWTRLACGDELQKAYGCPMKVVEIEGRYFAMVDNSPED